MGKDYKNGLEYYKDVFGKEEVIRIAKENELIDITAVAKLIVELDGRGHALSSYDGSEESIYITFKGEEYEFYIYRQN